MKKVFNTGQKCVNVYKIHWQIRIKNKERNTSRLSRLCTGVYMNFTFSFYFSNWFGLKPKYILQKKVNIRWMKIPDGTLTFY